MQWIILDANGVIHSGDESEMKYAFIVMTKPDVVVNKDDLEKYEAEWNGDLILAKCFAISK